MTTGAPRWPGERRAAISITLDNMGEAAEIQRGAWPADEPAGNHHSVTRDLPNLLDLLDEMGVSSTYFIEGWNADVYPDAISEVHERGHEVAFHGWQHEKWSDLEPEREAGLIAHSTSALRRLNLEVTGFRPPGGRLSGQSTGLLRAHGIEYCSPAGSSAAIADGLVFLPFEWAAIDAYYYAAGFAGLRLARGDSGDALAPADFAERVRELVDQRIESGGYLAVLFHPFLETEPERIAAMVEIIRAILADERVWCAPCREVTAWIRRHPDRFGDDPMLDRTTWSR